MKFLIQIFFRSQAARAISLAILRYTEDDLDPPAPGSYSNKVSLYAGTYIFIIIF